MGSIFEKETQFFYKTVSLFLVVKYKKDVHVHCAKSSFTLERQELNVKEVREINLKV